MEPLRNPSFNDLLKQAGPVGVSVLCFFVGLATVIYASFKLVAGLMTLEVVSDPFMFVLDMYLVLRFHFNLIGTWKPQSISAWNFHLVQQRSLYNYLKRN